MRKKVQLTPLSRDKLQDNRIHSLRMMNGRLIKTLQISAFCTLTDTGTCSNTLQIFACTYREGSHLMMCGEFAPFYPKHDIDTTNVRSLTH